MRFEQLNDNGNVATAIRLDISSHRNFDSSNWLSSNNSDTRNVYYTNTSDRPDNSQFISNYNIYDSESTTLESNQITNEDYIIDSTGINLKEVCNAQYRLNAQNNINLLKSVNNSQTTILDGGTGNLFAPKDDNLDTNESTNSTPLDEEKAFDHSDTDDMSEHRVHSVPRGIVNPNYPGFQHLAHTLQDYSNNENYYHSENEMTDDDIDIELTESSYDTELDKGQTIVESTNINNNVISNDIVEHTLLSSENNVFSRNETADSENEIPDLLKTVSKINNNSSSNIDYDYFDTDIENNFQTKDIIGDFNKEIEDEIKLLFNYNINIQDDLEDLRKDIKDTFAKPIETTINNISEVVNHVIKKLVETKSDDSEPSETRHEPNVVLDTEQYDEVSAEGDNETNTKKEMSMSRPTFLLIETNKENIKDAFLSDATDEINVPDYDTETLSNNVEKTIQQLSKELKKIIPKLDEMRENDKLWTSISSTCAIDGNFNEVINTSKVTQEANIENTEIRYTPEINKTSLRERPSVTNRAEQRSSRAKQKDLSAQRNASVRKSDSAIDSDLESFDVYNIETALPKLDIDAIESHLKAAAEEERRKRNDREEIRKRLAMGVDPDEYYSLAHAERPGKKPSLHSRLQNGKNLQICFMNETASDNESQGSEIERNPNHNTKTDSHSSIFSKNNFNHPYQTRPLSVNITKHDKISTTPSGAKLRPASIIGTTRTTTKSRSSHSLGHIELRESDFYALQTTLQTEARIALAQAKEMARIQMERSRRARSVSPVTEMLRRSMAKAGAPLAASRRRVSRQLLTDINVAQLQVIVNELHSQIESLNEALVRLLMARDDLHMGQDSMLVDIEDLTRYFGVKEQSKKTKGTTKSGVRRLASLVHK